jgi:hypothetical protein
MLPEKDSILEKPPHFDPNNIVPVLFGPHVLMSLLDREFQQLAIELPSL